MNVSESVAEVNYKQYIDPAIIQLLGHRYGDGLVYLRDDAERGLYDLAVRMGFINADGYLTPEGRSVFARHHFD